MASLQIFSFAASKYFAFCVNWILSIQHVGFVVGFNFHIIIIISMLALLLHILC